jgi:hypothetical protein
MTWYVALVAIVNLALGYALATYLRTGREKLALSSCDAPDQTGTQDWQS